jgi:two-component system NarL family response regulator
MEKIGVLIVDDHTLFRKGVRKILEGEDEIEVVGEASTGLEAVKMARELMPDVVLIDIKMPDMDGVEATRHIKRESPHIHIIFVTMLGEDEFVFAGMRAGARGYVLKEADPETLVRAIRAVYHGELLLSPSIAKRVLEYFTRLQEDKADAARFLFDGLTEREVEVLRSLAQGLSNKEIARKLFISEKTVKNHLYNIFQKLQVYDRSQAILYAIRKGLVEV